MWKQGDWPTNARRYADECMTLMRSSRRALHPECRELLKPERTAHVRRHCLSQRQGAALRFQDINDKAYATIDLTKLGPASEVTVEAMLYLNAFKAYNRTNANILSLQEDWNSSLQLFENIYEGQMVRGGTEFSLKKDELTEVITPSQWHHISLSIKPDGYSFGVDGKVIKSLRSSELANWCRKPATLEIGNFDGYIDEVVVRCPGAKAVKK